jgi:hypothetical protein
VPPAFLGIIFSHDLKLRANERQCGRDRNRIPALGTLVKTSARVGSAVASCKTGGAGLVNLVRPSHCHRSEQ